MDHLARGLVFDRHGGRRFVFLLAATLPALFRANFKTAKNSALSA